MRKYSKGIPKPMMSLSIGRPIILVTEVAQNFCKETDSHRYKFQQLKLGKNEQWAYKHAHLPRILRILPSNLMDTTDSDCNFPVQK